MVRVLNLLLCIATDEAKQMQPVLVCTSVILTCSYYCVERFTFPRSQGTKHSKWDSQKAGSSWDY